MHLNEPIFWIQLNDYVVALFKGKQGALAHSAASTRTPRRTHYRNDKCDWVLLRALRPSYSRSRDLWASEILTRDHKKTRFLGLSLRIARKISVARPSRDRL